MVKVSGPCNVDGQLSIVALTLKWCGRSQATNKLTNNDVDDGRANSADNGVNVALKRMHVHLKVNIASTIHGLSMLMRHQTKRSV